MKKEAESSVTEPNLKFFVGQSKRTFQDPLLPGKEHVHPDPAKAFPGLQIWSYQQT